MQLGIRIIRNQSDGRVTCTRDAVAGSQTAIPDGIIEPIGVCRPATLEIEQAIGVTIDIILWRRGMIDEQVAEDRTVFSVGLSESKLPGGSSPNSCLELPRTIPP